MEERSERILVAEDEWAVGRTIQKHLQSLGHSVQWARDGREAREILEREDFDRVFLDVMMPYLDGFELLMWIRRHPTKQGTWVALMTALAQSREVFEGFGYEPDQFVTKPVRLEDLLP
jgi:DNA-binding response OmpR family regulator